MIGASSGPAPGPRAPDLLTIDNLEVVYDDVVLVLRGVSVAVPKGAIVTLLGPNGAGKSTTLKSISGLLKAENGEIVAGEIRFDGRSITHSFADRIVRRGIFQVMEGRRIIGDMTVLDNLRAGAHTRRDREIESDIDRVYAYFPRLRERNGLPATCRRRAAMLAIGRAVMGRPRMMRSTAEHGAGTVLCRRVFAIIERLNRDLSITMLLVEQNANMALKVAEYGYIMEQGKIVLDGTRAALSANET
jgi:branched-chain amino acid transport system ATP-binding protein